MSVLMTGPTGSQGWNNRIAGSGLAVLFVRLGGVLVALANAAVVARQVGIESFGTYAVALGGATIAAFGGAAGTNRWILRTISPLRAAGREAEIRGAILGAASVLRTTVPIFTAVAILVTWALSQDAMLAASVGGVTAALALQQFVCDCLRGMGRVRLAACMDGRSGGPCATFVHTLLLLLPFMPLAQDGTNVSLPLAVFAMSVSGATFLGAAVLKRDLRSRMSGPALKVPLATCVAFAVTQVLLLAGAQADLSVAALTLHGEAVSALAIAQRAMILIALPLMAMQFVVAPHIAQASVSGDVKALEVMLRGNATLAAVPAVGLLLAMVAVPSSALEVVFGDGFSAARTPLLVLSVGQVANVVSGFCGVALSMTGRESSVLRITGVTLCVRVVLTISGSLLFGLSGLAVGSAVATAFMFAALWYSCRLNVGIKTHPLLKVR